jgi:small nuclear ribonucleoprotein (snRNP)-like protein
MSNAKTVTAKKESILELTKMIDAKVHVKCLGGREVVGILKGYDELVNLVLDDADEYIRGKLSLDPFPLCSVYFS